jgi:hypothetical protein
MGRVPAPSQRWPLGQVRAAALLARREPLRKILEYRRIVVVSDGRALLCLDRPPPRALAPIFGHRGRGANLSRSDACTFRTYSRVAIAWSRARMISVGASASSALRFSMTRERPPGGRATRWIRSAAGFARSQTDQAPYVETRRARPSSVVHPRRRTSAKPARASCARISSASGPASHDQMRAAAPGSITFALRLRRA